MKKIATGGFKRYMDYDGKRYEFSVSRYDKSAAEKIADNLRAKGFLARVENFGDKYAVYKRKK